MAATTTSRLKTGHETYEPAYATGRPHISHGLPFQEACAKHVRDTFKASRVYIVASASLSNNTDHVRKLQDALGDRLAGIRIGMRPHTYWSEVLEIAAAAKEAKADLLITLGAGSLTDGAKIIATALANDARTFEDLDKLHSGEDWDRQRSDLNAPDVPIVSVPTSLSGGEYSFLGGGTHDVTKVKYGFGHPTKGPELVVLDPNLTTSTPMHVWLQSGVRAVDHCVEGLCSLKATSASDENALKGLRLLVPGLLKTKQNPHDLDARFACQKGVIHAMSVVFQHSVPMGASHGIGHQLGPLGVGHGETSCILLPAVCRYNAGVNGEKQSRVAGVLWENPAVAEMLTSSGLTRSEAQLGDVLAAFVQTLGMPGRLKDVGVGEDSFQQLAENALHDKWCSTNPRPLETSADVLEILHAVT